MRHKGWHSRGYLPHFDSPETVQFVTFRLVDSLPAAMSRNLKMEHGPPGRFKPTVEETILRFDQELDAGWGACWLRDAGIASMVQDALLFFDGVRYRLLGWCVMPNHVHVVFEMPHAHSLSAIVKGWKSFTSRQANAQLGRNGAFWDADYFDRYMRNEAHFDADHRLRRKQSGQGRPRQRTFQMAVELRWSADFLARS